MVNILKDDEGEQFLSSPSFFMSTGELTSFYETQVIKEVI